MKELCFFCSLKVVVFWIILIKQGCYFESVILYSDVISSCTTRTKKKKVVNNSERSSFFSYSACGVKPYSRCFFNEPFQIPNYVFIPSDTNTRHWRAKKEYYSKIRTTILHPDGPDSSTRDSKVPAGVSLSRTLNPFEEQSMSLVLQGLFSQTKIDLFQKG